MYSYGLWNRDLNVDVSEVGTSFCDADQAACAPDGAGKRRAHPEKLRLGQPPLSTRESRALVLLATSPKRTRHQYGQWQSSVVLAREGSNPDYS